MFRLAAQNYYLSHVMQLKCKYRDVTWTNNKRSYVAYGSAHTFSTSFGVVPFYKIIALRSIFRESSGGWLQNRLHVRAPLKSVLWVTFCVCTSINWICICSSCWGRMRLLFAFRAHVLQTNYENIFNATNVMAPHVPTQLRCIISRRAAVLTACLCMYLLQSNVVLYKNECESTARKSRAKFVGRECAREFRACSVSHPTPQTVSDAFVAHAP